MNQGPSYFGDLDESDGKLLEHEQAAEEEGLSKLTASPFFLLIIRRGQIGRKLTQI
jgi:hypothetical protein